MVHATGEKENSILVIFEDNDVLVVDKPSGMLVHDDGGHGHEGTLVEWFLGHCPDAKGVGEPGKSKEGRELERSGVVHRLDRETSGVLILAKTAEAFTHLKEQFHDRHAKKEYRAFVYGTMKEKWGTIDRPIGRSSRDFRLRSAQRGAKGTLRDAVTDWELIGLNGSFAYLRLMPKTGRTHQIRVHLKAIGRPVVKDELYAPENLLEGPSLGFERLALHAHMLEIVLPNGKEERFIAPQPQDFEKAENLITVSS